MRVTFIALLFTHVPGSINIGHVVSMANSLIDETSAAASANIKFVASSARNISNKLWECRSRRM